VDVRDLIKLLAVIKYI